MDKYTINYTDIGKRIRCARKTKKKSQEWLAENADVGTTHISHIETGNTKLSLKTLILIANALDVSTEELLCDNIEESKNIYNGEINTLLKKCNTKDIRIISDVIKFVLVLLNKYR